MNKTIVPHKNAFVNHFYNFYSHFMKFFLKNVSKDFKKPFFSIVGIYFCNFEKSFIHFSVFRKNHLTFFFCKNLHLYICILSGDSNASLRHRHVHFRILHSSIICYILPRVKKSHSLLIPNNIALKWYHFASISTFN